MFVIVYPIREILYYKTLINTMFSVTSTVSDLYKALGFASLGRETILTINNLDGHEDEDPNETPISKISKRKLKK